MSTDLYYVYINVTTDQLLSIFCLSKVLRDFFLFPKKIVYAV